MGDDHNEVKVIQDLLEVLEDAGDDHDIVKVVQDLLEELDVRDDTEGDMPFSWVSEYR